MDVIEYISSFHSFGKRPGLHRIRRLLELLGNPQLSLRCIHVAGTNGKGSVCCYISNILRCAGLKTGLFISPYVLDFRERFQINGEMIPQVVLEALTEQIRPVVESLPPEDKPTQFDLITAIAFLYFKQSNCDVVVLETGLGGMYDATNVLQKPLCTVITSISLDHTTVLGQTIGEIAVQKAGIIKQGCPTVLYPVQQPAAERVVRRAAAEQNSSLILPDLSLLKVEDLGLFGSRVSYSHYNFTLRMCGGFQPLNAITALEAVKQSGLNIGDDAITAGIQQAFFPARCELLSQNPPLLLDGAHNPDGMRALQDVVKKHMPRPVTAVMSMMADKDAATAMGIIAPCFSHIFCVASKNARSLTADDLAALGAAYTNCTPCNSPAIALQSALEEGASTVICGSLYLASELRTIVKKEGENEVFN